MSRPAAARTGARDGAFVGRGHQPCVLRHDAVREGGRQRRPCLQPASNLVVGQLHLQPATRHIEGDQVAVAERGDGTAGRRLGRDVPGHEPAGCTRKAAVRHERDAVGEARPDECRRNREHFPHAWPALWTFVPNHHDVAGPDAPALHRVERGFLAVEHPRGPPMLHQVVPGHLDHAAVGCQVAAQHDEPAVRLQRRFERPHHLLMRRLVRIGGLFADRAAGHGQFRRVEHAGLALVGR